MAEKELDRLGFRRREVLPSSGDRNLDNAIAIEMGPLVDKAIGNIVTGEGYKGATVAQQGEIIRRALIMTRGMARSIARAKHPQLFIKERIRMLPRRQRRLFQ